MYAAVVDPYCYAGSTVLKNRPGLRSQAALDRFEAMATARRFLEPMPVGRWGVRHYRAVHWHIFQDVYSWAGRPRTIRMSKGESVFCYPEQIDAALRQVFAALKQSDFLRDRTRRGFAAEAAHFLADLNAVHAFRDGNGRTQLAFLALLAEAAGYPLDFSRLAPQSFLNAMIASFYGEEGPLAAALFALAEDGRVDQ
jgi:cell filamentation protein